MKTTNNQRPENQAVEGTPDEPIQGIITARKCPSCGHHEIGIVTKTGEFIAFKPGMRAGIFWDTN